MTSSDILGLVLIIVGIGGFVWLKYSENHFR